VEDDGRGFPYHGSYDLSSLKKTRRGPVSLMERVASLAGDLTLTSTAAGSRLDIGLPVGHRSVADKLSP
jgi:signal transduction histidine kinase